MRWNQTKAPPPPSGHSKPKIKSFRRESGGPLGASSTIESTGSIDEWWAVSGGRVISGECSMNDERCTVSQLGLGGDCDFSANRALMEELSRGLPVGPSRRDYVHFAHVGDVTLAKSRRHDPMNRLSGLTVNLRRLVVRCFSARIPVLLSVVIRIIDGAFGCRDLVLVHLQCLSFHF